MFNLLMFNVDWESTKVSIPMTRMFEYTEDHIVEQFQKNGIPHLDRLTALPCLFCEEGTEDEIAYVGQINQARASGNNLFLEIVFDKNLPLLKNSMLYENRLSLNMAANFEFSRNHWAIKDVDLYRFLLPNIRLSRQHPTVFRIAEHENIDITCVSVMMPFATEFNEIYASIRQSASNAGLQCLRADDFWENSSIIQDVVELIDRSRIVVCDCTGRNPNVFYEAGIAHTLGREVILITQNEQDIPFDLRHLRYVKYLNNTEGRSKLTETLQRRMKTILGQ